MSSDQPPWKALEKGYENRGYTMVADKAQWSLWCRDENEARDTAWRTYVFVDRRGFSKQAYRFGYYHMGDYSGFSKSTDTDEFLRLSKPMAKHIHKLLKARKITSK